MYDWFRGCLLSYRALFTWLNPVGYLSSRLVRPIALGLIFSAATSYYGGRVGVIVVGASLLAAAHAVIYGMALSVGNERNYGTLEIWLASPQSTLGAIGQRALPHVLDGAFSALLTYFVCSLLFQEFFLPLGSFVILLFFTLITSAGIGLVISGINIRVADMFLWPNIAILAMMILSGVLIGPQHLPGLVRPLAMAFPLSHLMTSVRDTSALPGLLDGFLAGSLVGALWVAAGIAAVRLALHTRTDQLHQ